MRKAFAGESNWIAFSDLMTGLMIIFMFIALNYILQVIEHKFVEQEIYNSLQLEFDSELKNGEIELTPDGSVRFKSGYDESALFNPGSSFCTTYFESQLDEFIPRYIKLITSSDHFESLKEIRIEGHTDQTPPRTYINGEDSYEYNLRLSSERAYQVLKYIRSHNSYQDLDPEFKNRFDFLLTANGLSFSRALNVEKELIFLSHDKSPNNELSRRVEFRIITSNDKLIEEIMDTNKE